MCHKKFGPGVLYTRRFSLLRFRVSTPSGSITLNTRIMVSRLTIKLCLILNRLVISRYPTNEPTDPPISDKIADTISSKDDSFL